MFNNQPVPSPEVIDSRYHELYKLTDPVTGADPRETANRLYLTATPATQACDPLARVFTTPTAVVGPALKEMRREMARWQTDTDDTGVEGRVVFNDNPTWEVIGTNPAVLHIQWNTVDVPTPTPLTNATPVPTPSTYCTRLTGSATTEVEYQLFTCSSPTSCVEGTPAVYNDYTYSTSHDVPLAPLQGLYDYYQVTIYTIARDGHGSYWSCKVTSDVVGECS